MRKFFALALLFSVTNVCVAQFTDSFSDGNFTSNPVWSGSSADFIVNGSNQLQLTNTVAGISYLSSSFSIPDLSQVDAEWQMYVKQTFSSSGSNYGRVYLVSDQSNLTQPLNGYYLQFGEAGTLDAIELFRQTGTASLSVCRGTNSSISSSFSVSIKVLRTGAGTWQIFVDYSGGTNFVLEASGSDATHLSSSFTGVQCVYSITNANKFFYDDFAIVNTTIPDTSAPTLQSISVVSSSTIDILFSESLDPLVSNNVFNYSMDQGIGMPFTATLQVDNTTVRVVFTNIFKNGYQHQLSVSGIKDITGNMISPITKSFLYFMPIAAQAKDIIISEFFPDPNPVIGLPDQEFIEIYNRSKSPFDLAGWKLTDRSSTATFQSQIILPQEYWIISSSSASPFFTPFGKTIGVSNFPTLNNNSDKIILIDPTGLIVDSLVYTLKWYNDSDKQQGGWTLEMLNSDTLRYDSANWLAALDVTGGTPGRQNSQFGNKFDQTSPLWMDLSTVNDHQLEVEFNEALELITIQNLNNFKSDLYGNPVSATLSANNKTITLSFQNSFANGVSDTLSISGLTDFSGNLIAPSKKGFLYFQSSATYPKDIIINEFMADPTPIVGLPEAEFIELYNRSTNPIDLAGWSLSDGTFRSTFASKIIKSKEYWIVSSSSMAQQFASFGSVISLSGFPSLNNNGDKILLLDPSGQKIDSLTYNLKWFNDADKQQGGWSLELLNSDSVRYDSANWLPSVDATGGTPGKKNSQDGKFFDQAAPGLISVSALSSTQIQLLFSEKLEQSSAQSLSNYTVNNQIGNPQSAVLSADKKSVILHFQSVFINGISNTISLVGISDLSGNILSSTQKDFLYFIAQAENPKDIVITEIMADPAPVVGLPEAEYIEIYNRSPNPIDLLNWTLSDGGAKSKFPSVIIQPNEYYIIHSSASAQFNAYPNKIGLSSFPSLNNSSDSIVLKNSLALTIDSVAYAASWYRSLDKQDGGWSLEIIDAQNTCGEESNWTASEDITGGSPGKQNSVNANKPDLTGPKLLSVVVVQSNELLLKFDEKLEKQISLSSFTLVPDITLNEVKFNGKALRGIKLVLAQELSNRKLYSIKVTTLRDCNGNSIQEEFNSLEFALPEAGDSLDLVLNEILFNPRPNGVDFVEIYNNSPKYINLKNWKLANIENGILKNLMEISPGDFILSPLTHLALTENVEMVKNNYPNNLTGNFLNVDLPSLPDDEGSIAIVNGEGKIIDQFLYAKDFQSSLLKDEEGVSLERISFLQSSQDKNNWQSASSIFGFATPGYLNSNARPETSIDEASVVIEPEVFNPDYEFAKINFDFSQSNISANVKIFDQQGRLIKTIANNEILTSEGFLKWDGDQEDGRKARLGYYVVWFEIFDADGFLKTYRKRVVITGN